MNDLVKRLAKNLIENDFDLAIGIIGSGLSYVLVDEFERLGGKFILVSHESSAPVMAASYNLLGDKKAFSISIKGPGFTNSFSGLCSCYYEGWTCLHITEAYSISASESLVHKRFDQIGLMSLLTESINSLASTSLNDMSYFKKGINYLELTDSDISTTPFKESASGSKTDVPIIDATDFTKPIIVIGKSVPDECLKILKNLKIPLLTTVDAKGKLDEELINNYGIITGTGKLHSPENLLLKYSDACIFIGVEANELIRPLAHGNLIIIDRTTLNSNTFKESQLFVKIKNCEYSNEDLKNIRFKTTLELDEILKSNHFNPAHVFDYLSRWSVDHNLVCDTGNFCIYAEHFWKSNPHRKYFGSNRGRNMGLSIPMSLGLALVPNSKPFICAVGDGGIGYYLNDIKYFSELNLPVCILFLSDNDFGSVTSNIPQTTNSSSVIRIDNSHWINVIRSYNIKSSNCNSLEGFKDIIKTWDSSSPLFIHIDFDKEVYSAIIKNLR